MNKLFILKIWVWRLVKTLGTFCSLLWYL